MLAADSSDKFKPIITDDSKFAEMDPFQFEESVVKFITFKHRLPCIGSSHHQVQDGKCNVKFSMKSYLLIPKLGADSNYGDPKAHMKSQVKSSSKENISCFSITNYLFIAEADKTAALQKFNAGRLPAENTFQNLVLEIMDQFPKPQCVKSSITEDDSMMVSDTVLIDGDEEVLPKADTKVIAFTVPSYFNVEKIKTALAETNINLKMKPDSMLPNNIVQFLSALDDNGSERQCIRCEYKSSNFYDLVLHCLNHKIWICRSCLKTFTNIMMFKYHVQSHTAEFGLYCSECKLSNTYVFLCSHIAECHTNAIILPCTYEIYNNVLYGYLCINCGIVKLTKALIDYHIECSLLCSQIRRINLSKLVINKMTPPRFNTLMDKMRNLQFERKQNDDVRYVLEDVLQRVKNVDADVHQTLEDILKRVENLNNDIKSKDDEAVDADVIDSGLKSLEDLENEISKFETPIGKESDVAGNTLAVIPAENETKNTQRDDFSMPEISVSNYMIRQQDIIKNADAFRFDFCKSNYNSRTNLIIVNQIIHMQNFSNNPKEKKLIKIVAKESVKQMLIRYMGFSKDFQLRTPCFGEPCVNNGILYDSNARLFKPNLDAFSFTLLLARMKIKLNAKPKNCRPITESTTNTVPLNVNQLSVAQGTSTIPFQWRQRRFNEASNPMPNLESAPITERTTNTVHPPLNVNQLSVTQGTPTIPFQWGQRLFNEATNSTPNPESAPITERTTNTVHPLLNVNQHGVKQGEPTIPFQCYQRPFNEATNTMPNLESAPITERTTNTMHPLLNVNQHGVKQGEATIPFQCYQRPFNEATNSMPNLESVPIIERTTNTVRPLLNVNQHSVKQGEPTIPFQCGQRPFNKATNLMPNLESALSKLVKLHGNKEDQTQVLPMSIMLNDQALHKDVVNSAKGNLELSAAMKDNISTPLLKTATNTFHPNNNFSSSNVTYLGCIHIQPKEVQNPSLPQDQNSRNILTEQEFHDKPDSPSSELKNAVDFPISKDSNSVEKDHKNKERNLTAKTLAGSSVKISKVLKNNPTVSSASSAEDESLALFSPLPKNRCTLALKPSREYPRIQSVSCDSSLEDEFSVKKSSANDVNGKQVHDNERQSAVMLSEELDINKAKDDESSDDIVEIISEVVKDNTLTHSPRKQGWVASKHFRRYKRIRERKLIQDKSGELLNDNTQLSRACKRIQVIGCDDCSDSHSSDHKSLVNDDQVLNTSLPLDDQVKSITIHNKFDVSKGKDELSEDIVEVKSKVLEVKDDIRVSKKRHKLSSRKYKRIRTVSCDDSSESQSDGMSSINVGEQEAVFCGGITSSPLVNEESDVDKEKNFELSNNIIEVISNENTLIQSSKNRLKLSIKPSRKYKRILDVGCGSSSGYKIPDEKFSKCHFNQDNVDGSSEAQVLNTSLQLANRLKSMVTNKKSVVEQAPQCKTVSTPSARKHRLSVKHSKKFRRIRTMSDDSSSEAKSPTSDVNKIGIDCISTNQIITTLSTDYQMIPTGCNEVLGIDKGKDHQLSDANSESISVVATVKSNTMRKKRCELPLRRTKRYSRIEASSCDISSKNENLYASTSNLSNDRVNSQDSDRNFFASLPLDDQTTAMKLNRGTGIKRKFKSVKRMLEDAQTQELTTINMCTSTSKSDQQIEFKNYDEESLLKPKSSSGVKKKYKSVSKKLQEMTELGTNDINLSASLELNDRLIECPQCKERRPFSESSLTMHMFEHYNIKAFECSLCDQQFLKQSSMDKHARDKHNRMFVPYRLTRCPNYITQIVHQALFCDKIK